MTTFRILLPSLRPVGGIHKCFDYANHAESLGYRVIFHTPRPPTKKDKIFSREDFSHFLARREEMFADLRIPFSLSDLYFFSLPSDFRVLERLVQRGLPPGNLIHIIQNVRHASVDFQRGYAIRLLSRPMVRIAINDIVRDAIAPFLHPGSVCETIPLGHRSDFFLNAPRTEALKTPIRIGYMTWKSDIGDRVAARLGPDERFEFRPVRKPLDWPALKSFYDGIDVFLGAPNREEGFYLPGLEAMAAGCLVVTPDAGGNMAYCRFNENCIPYPFQDAGAASEAVSGIASMPLEAVRNYRERSYETACSFSLDAERDNFRKFIHDNFSGQLLPA